MKKENVEEKGKLNLKVNILYVLTLLNTVVMIISVGYVTSIKDDVTANASYAAVQAVAEIFQKMEDGLEDLSDGSLIKYDLPEDHNITELNSESFINKIDSGDDFLIFLGYPNCPFCQELLPEVNKNMSEIDKDVELYYINTDYMSSEALKAANDVSVVPTILIYKDGEISNTFGPETGLDYTALYELLNTK